MALDSSAKLTNVRNSIKKYFVDTLSTIEAIDLSFDRSIVDPYLENTSLTKWVLVNFGRVSQQDVFSIHDFDVVCCTRQDAEGVRLMQMVDTVQGYLYDSTQTDRLKRITLYNDAWTSIGSLLITDNVVSFQDLARDETKFVVIACAVRWAAKV